MARRMHCVWFVSFFSPNNPKSASTPLAPASTHAFEVNYVAPSPSTTLPSPSLPSAQLTETQFKSVFMVLLILSTLDIYANRSYNSVDYGRLPLNQKFQNFRNEANLSSTNPKPLLAAYDLIAVLGFFIIVLTTYNLR